MYYAVKVGICLSATFFILQLLFVIICRNNYFLNYYQLLNSPWDVCFEPTNQIVYIAMAGQHQIWVHSTLDGVTKAFSGDGYERNLNGQR